MRKKRVTIQDVAVRAGVSAPTVSKILNDRLCDFRVRQDTIRRVKQLAKQMGYSPNRFAQSLRFRKGRIIGVSTIASRNVSDENLDGSADLLPLGRILSGIFSVASPKGYDVLLLPRYEDEFQDVPIPQEDLFPELIDGLLYLEPTRTHSEYVQIGEEGSPIVLIGRCPTHSDLPLYDLDNVQACYQLTRHLLELGATHVAIVLPEPAEKILTNDRLEGYRRALQDSGIKIRDQYITRSHINLGKAYPIAKRLLEENPQIDGLVAGGGMIFHDVVHAASDLNRSIPIDLKLVSFDDSILCLTSFPKISALDTPFTEMGFRATQMLIEIIESGPNGGEQRFVTGVLNIRESTCPEYAKV